MNREELDKVHKLCLEIERIYNDSETQLDNLDEKICDAIVTLENVIKNALQEVWYEETYHPSH